MGGYVKIQAFREGILLLYFLGFFPMFLYPGWLGQKQCCHSFWGRWFQVTLPMSREAYVMSLIMFDPMWTNEWWAFKASRVSEDAAVDRESKNRKPPSRLLRLAQPWSSHFVWDIHSELLTDGPCSVFNVGRLPKLAPRGLVMRDPLFENISSSKDGILEAPWNRLAYDCPYVSWTLILVAIDCFDNFLYIHY